MVKGTYKRKRLWGLTDPEGGTGAGTVAGAASLALTS